MNVDILDESSFRDADGAPVDIERLTRLSRFVMEQMRLAPATEMTMIVVDAGTMTEYNEKWMDKTGPTDVLSFPMDELRPGTDDLEAEEGYLGDMVLCPEVATADAEAEGLVLADHLELLTVHGILHLLGYDHAEPEEYEEMFALQDVLLARWRDGGRTTEEAQS
ncbi:rRNA maturation RNase YbeY [Mumia sp. zg.B21]|uniref:rRNA maturation RNase YbeY n=1 Tax=Mumia sp. zg.B21 TaxID=2855447 RepID=UPI001C6F379F|nr:rRNA maturation RNase YbeY [Mumia sp. zg.B21]MBW9211275.1 rRNA maturation RNase YbeY [Mumia sp. zg.B21]